MTTALRAEKLPVTASARSPLAILESEDWLAVFVGFLSLLLVLVGVRPPLPQFGWTSWLDLGTLLAPQNLTSTLVAGAGVGLLASIGVFFMNGSLARFALGFPVVYGLSWLSQIAAGQSDVSAWGFEYVIFALAVGLLVSNTIGVPGWLKEGVRTEYYKTGLVILGAGMLFADLARGGMLGIVQAVLVVVPVWFVAERARRRGGVLLDNLVGAQGTARAQVRPGIGVIWERFPKFVVGFLVASLVFSFLISPALVGETKGFLAGFRTMWFALAFVSIGLETRFAELVATGDGRPAAAFLGGQAFNVIWTLILAYLLFGGIFFAAPTFS